MALSKKNNLDFIIANDKIKQAQSDLKITELGDKPVVVFQGTTGIKNGVGTNLEITNASANVQKAALTKPQCEYQICIDKLELAKLIGEKYW